MAYFAMAGVHALIGVFGLIRMTLRPPVPMDKQGKSTPTAVHPSGAAIESVQHYASDEAGDD